ncbi:hypothetical protein ABFV05_010808 [Capra hircus]
MSRLKKAGRLPGTNSLAPAQGTMASVPSAGCLLARNQYYRKASVSSGTSLTSPDSANFVGDDKAQLGSPEVAESTWWFKSFFQSVPVFSNVKREDQSACGGNGPGSRSKKLHKWNELELRALNKQEFFIH